MNMGLSERHLPRLAPLVLLALVAGLLFPLVPASAEDHDIQVRIEDTNEDAEVDISEVREGGHITLAFSLVSGKRADADRYVYLALSGTAQEGSQGDYTIDITDSGKPDEGPPAGALYSHKIILRKGDYSTTARSTC